MFYVELIYNNGGQKLGNTEGQGFYRYNKVSTIIEILKEIKNTHKQFLNGCDRWEIYQCNESDIYKGEGKFKLIEIVSCH